MLVPWLLEHPGAEVDEVCERFGLSRAELAGDLDVLGYCGLPGYGGGDLIEASIVGDRVSVRMADYFRRPLALNLQEAVTLLLAGQALASVATLPEATPLRTAVRKLEELLERRAGGPLDVEVDLTAPGDEHVPALRDAVQDGSLVHLRYHSASRGETTERDVEPWAVVATGGAWYLQAWCREAAAPRDFRLDRIEALQVLGERITTEPGPAGPPVYEPRDDDHTIRLLLDRTQRWFLDEIVVDTVEERGERLAVTFRTANLSWAARRVLPLAAHVSVVEPPELAAAVRELADRTLRSYASTGP